MTLPPTTAAQLELHLLSTYFAFLNSSDFWTGPSASLWKAFIQPCVISFLHCHDSTKINGIALTCKWSNTLADQTYWVYFAYKTIKNGFKNFSNETNSLFSYIKSTLCSGTYSHINGEWMDSWLSYQETFKERYIKMCVFLCTTVISKSLVQTENYHIQICYWINYRVKKNRHQMLVPLQSVAVLSLTLLELGIYPRDLLPLFIPIEPH